MKHYNLKIAFPWWVEDNPPLVAYCAFLGILVQNPLPSSSEKKNEKEKKTCKRWTPLPVVMYTLMIYVTYTCIDRREYSFTIAFGKTTIFFISVNYIHAPFNGKI